MGKGAILNCSIGVYEIEGSINDIDNIDFSDVDKLFEIEKEYSLNFLRQSLS